MTSYDVQGPVAVGVGGAAGEYSLDVSEAFAGRQENYPQVAVRHEVMTGRPWKSWSGNRGTPSHW